jgi:hypothetical protein
VFLVIEQLPRYCDSPIPLGCFVSLSLSFVFLSVKDDRLSMDLLVKVCLTKKIKRGGKDSIRGNCTHGIFPPLSNFRLFPLTHTHTLSLPLSPSPSLTHTLSHTHSLSHSHTLYHSNTHAQTNTHTRTHTHNHTHSLSLSHTYTHIHALTRVSPSRFFSCVFTDRSLICSLLNFYGASLDYFLQT